MGVWLAVKGSFYSVNVAYEVESSQTFGNMSSIVFQIKEDDSIQKVKIRSSDDKFNMIVGLNAPLSLCQVSVFQCHI